MSADREPQIVCCRWDVPGKHHPNCPNATLVLREQEVIPAPEGSEPAPDGDGT